MANNPTSSPQKTDQNQIVVFSLDEPHYALPLSTVERVIRAVEITPLPKAPEIVLGVLNMGGQIIPVMNVRTRFRLPPRKMHVDDRFIISRTSSRLVALAVDSEISIRTLADADVVSAKQALPFAEYVQGVAKLDDNLVLIHDLDQFLSLDEERQLDAALLEGSE